MHLFWVFPTLLCSGLWKGHGESGWKDTRGYALIEAQYQANSDLQTTCWVDHKVLKPDTTCYASATCVENEDQTMWSCEADAYGTCVDEEPAP